MNKWILTLALVMGVGFAQAQITQQGFSEAEQKLLEKDAKRLWESRDNKESLEEAVSKFDMIAGSNPQNLEVLAYLSRGHYLLGEFHNDDTDRKKSHFEKGRAYGEQGLMTNPEFKKLFSKDVEKAVSKITLKEIDVLFWASANLGRWARANGVFSSLKFKDQIVAMIKQVEKLKPDYYYGAVPRYWGGYYAIAPSIAGGDMKKSLKNFKDSIAMAPEFLGTHTLFADAYWVKEENKKEFEKELNFVLTAPLGPADIHPENKMEKERAGKLLAKIKDLF